MEYQKVNKFNKNSLLVESTICLNPFDAHEYVLEYNTPICACS